MPNWLKLFAVVCCLMPFVNMLLIRANEPTLSRGPITRQVIAARQAATQAANVRAIAAIAIGELGAIVLLIEAFMRDYESPRGWPIAIALFGVLSFGLASLVYYAIWGWQPTKRVFGLDGDFCPVCAADTLDKSAPSLMMHNLLGTQFLGSADRCETCGSTVRTIWFTIVLPLVPLGSYRVIPVGKAMVHRSEFRSRKTKWRTSHIVGVYSFVATVALTIWWLAHD